jgi:Cytochrome P460
MVRLLLTMVACGVMGCNSATTPEKSESAAVDNKAPQAEKKSQWEGYQEWYHPTKGRPITGDPTGFLGDKDREKGYREVYVNKVGEDVNKGDAPYLYPAGSVIVREVYNDKMDWEVKKTPVLTISIKLPKGSAPESKDWEYVLVVPGEDVQRGQGTSEMGQFCSKCHLKAEEINDWRLTNATFFAKQQ